jgi:hypothetical protein
MVNYESDDDGRKASRVRAFLIRDWPYFAMLGLALFGVAYTSVARQAMTNYNPPIVDPWHAVRLWKIR